MPEGLNDMRLFWLCLVAILLYLTVPYLSATEDYAEKTGRGCEYCHLDSSGGSELTKAGKDFLRSLTKETKDEDIIVFTQGRKGVSHYIRFLAGFLHIITAIFWFGTILYVHLILKPAYAVHGLPRELVRVGLFSMLIMGITGTILTIYRIPSISFFYETRFGILLLIKIALFLIMACTALYVVIFLSAKLRKMHHENHSRLKGDFTVDDLIYFDGTRRCKTYVGYKGKIYDMSSSKFWKNGVHFQRHKAGIDLTEMLKNAPHGEDKIFDMPMIGKLAHSRMKKGLVRHEKVFYFMAYLNLIFVILIILILALWRWW
jgi:predicted heme/steroid binding protein